MVLKYIIFKSVSSPLFPVFSLFSPPSLSLSLSPLSLPSLSLFLSVSLSLSPGSGPAGWQSLWNQNTRRRNQCHVHHRYKARLYTLFAHRLLDAIFREVIDLAGITADDLSTHSDINCWQDLLKAHQLIGWRLFASSLWEPSLSTWEFGSPIRISRKKPSNTDLRRETLSFKRCDTLSITGGHRRLKPGLCGMPHWWRPAWLTWG